MKHTPFKNNPKPCNEYPGYYYIPNFENYCINTSGEVISLKRGITLRSTERSYGSKSSPGKYHHYGLYREGNSIPSNLSRHRLVLLTFEGMPDDIEKTHVNHINGIPGDDRLENLEWCTPYENISHAFETGLRDSTFQPMESWNLSTNEKTIYKTVANFVRETGMPVGTIRKRLARDNAFIYDGFRYRYTRDEWSNTTQLELRDLHNTTGKEILVLNLRNHKVAKFNSGAQAADFIGLLKGVINSNTRKRHMVPVAGYLFRYNDDDPEWPVLTPLQEDFLKYQDYPIVFRSGVAFYDHADRRVFLGFYEEAAEWLNRPVAVVRNYIREGRLLNGYRGVHVSDTMQYLKDINTQK